MIEPADIEEAVVIAHETVDVFEQLDQRRFDVFLCCDERRDPEILESVERCFPARLVKLGVGETAVRGAEFLAKTENRISQPIVENADRVYSARIRIKAHCDPIDRGIAREPGHASAQLKD